MPVDDAGGGELGGVAGAEAAEVSHDGDGYASEGDFGDVFPVVVCVGSPGGCRQQLGGHRTRVEGFQGHEVQVVAVAVPQHHGHGGVAHQNAVEAL